MNLHPPLVELLGARWGFATPVVGAAWNADGRLAGFGLGDGAVVMARATWDGGPSVKARAGGGIEVVPPQVTSPAVSRIAVHRGACRALASDGLGGFVTGGADGCLAQVSADGEVHAGTAFAGREVTRVAGAEGGWRACASGPDVQIGGPTRAVLKLPAAATALAFRPGGRVLAIGHNGGVTIWQASGLSRLTCDGRPVTLGWSPDGAWLVAGLVSGGLHAWRPLDGDAGGVAVPGEATAVAHALSFSSDGTLMAADGGPRPRSWDVSDGGFAGPGACGLASGRTPVCAVAFHPAHRLLAAGHSNGAVLLCQPGADDALFAKAAGGGAVTALAWSPDGSGLAIGTAEGEAAVLALPDGWLRMPADTNTKDAAAASPRGESP